MRMILCVRTALLLALFGTANAATYQLQYVGKPLAGDPNYGPVPGATKVKMMWIVPALAPAQCEWYGFPYLTSYTDGKNTLASLAAAGYLPLQSSAINLCFNKAGTKITSWTFGVAFRTQPIASIIYGYTLDNNASTANGADRITLDSQDAQGNDVITARSMAAKPGKWTITVLP